MTNLDVQKSDFIVHIHELLKKNKGSNNERFQNTYDVYTYIYENQKVLEVLSHTYDGRKFLALTISKAIYVIGILSDDNYVNPRKRDMVELLNKVMDCCDSLLI
jgi:hypothetical protein